MVVGGSLVVAIALVADGADAGDGVLQGVLAALGLLLVFAAGGLGRRGHQPLLLFVGVLAETGSNRFGGGLIGELEALDGILDSGDDIVSAEAFAII